MKPLRRRRREPKANTIITGVPAVVTDPHDGVMGDAASCSAPTRKVLQGAANNRDGLQGNHSW